MMNNMANELNRAQQEAVEHRGSPLLILAGAGSGKTKTLTTRAASLVERKEAQPEEVLLVTFTNKAAGEMKERIRQMTGQELPYTGTFHSFAARLLRTRGQERGIDPGFVIYDAGEAEELVKEILSELELDPKRFKPRAIAQAISSVKQELVNPSEYAGMARGVFQEATARVYGEYSRRLKRYLALDFDDLLGEAVALLEESERVREEQQEKFVEILVDEYQDTNLAQYRLTKLLAESRKRLTVVGDASQSIYKWRGADYRNLTRLRRDFPNLTEIRLEENYRSTETILGAATAVIEHNNGHPILKLYTQRKGGEPIELVAGTSAEDEAAQVGRKVGELTIQGYDLKEIAILYRTNAQSRALEEMLIRAGIPYVLVGGTKFYERKEVKDVLAYLKILHNPEDGVNRARAEKLGKRRLAELTAKREQIIGEVKNAQEVVELVLATTQYLSRFDEEVEEERTRIENVRELVAVAREFGSLGEFLENVALVQAEYYAGEKKRPRGKEREEAVTLMTLHASKGTEYRAVFLVGMEEGLFPHSRSLTDKEEMEEERRLMYVGITRAKERLYLSYAKRRWSWGGSSEQRMSRFVEEIPQELVVGREQTSRVGAGVKLEELSNKQLEQFLAGEIAVEELLSIE